MFFVRRFFKLVFLYILMIIITPFDILIAILIVGIDLYLVYIQYKIGMKDARGRTKVHSTGRCRCILREITVIGICQYLCTGGSSYITCHQGITINSLQGGDAEVAEFYKDRFH